MHLKNHLLSAFLFGSACKNPSDDSESLVETSQESAIFGPQASELFSERCDPEVFAQIAESLGAFNAGVLDQIGRTDESIEIRTHASELTDEENIIFYDDGGGSIQGYLQTNALYFSSDFWDIGCVGTYIYSPRSESDTTLDLYGGEFTVYLQPDEGYQSIRVLWTSARQPETPAGIFFWDNESWNSSSDEYSIPDLHDALAHLAEFVEEFD